MSHMARYLYSQKGGDFMLNKVDGNKTYAVVVVTIAFAIAGAYLGYFDLPTAGQMILAALGVGGLRSAVSKVE